MAAVLFSVICLRFLVVNDDGKNAQNRTFLVLRMNR